MLYLLFKCCEIMFWEVNDLFDMLIEILTTEGECQFSQISN